MTAKIVVPEVDPVTLVMRAQPQDDYERAVLQVYEGMQAPDVMQQICARWFPTHGREVTDAFVAWREKHADFLAEIKDRTHAIWVSQGKGDVRVVKVVEYFRRKQRYEAYMRDFDATPVRIFEQKCIDYRALLKSPAWDLPRKFDLELALIHARPRPEPVSAAPASS